MTVSAAESVAARFLHSALGDQGAAHTTEEAVAWLKGMSADGHLVVRQIPLDQLKDWSMHSASGELVHKSGRFFRVAGLRAQSDLGPIREWDQPIIDQPEIGVLGIIAKEMDGRLHFLMQAKMEPGNPLGVQLTPTVQATRSNYTQVHQGTRPPFIDYFLERGRAKVLVDQLQVEQGSAFLRKRNRNIIVETTDELEVDEGFRWLTLGQVKNLLALPNVVSMDTRTVLACIPLAEPRATHASPLREFAAQILGSYSALDAASTDEEVLGWLTELRCQHQLILQRVGLQELRGWHISELEVAHEDGRFFRVLGVEIEADSREVVRWNQPLLGAVEQGLIAFLVTEIDGTLHCLVQAKIEAGGFDTLTIAPTVQIALGYEQRNDVLSWPPFTELVEDAPAKSIRYSCVQSEEGGRFFRVENEYRFVQVEDGQKLDLPPNFLWVTLRQLHELLRFGLVGVEARSLLSCLRFT